MTKSDFCELRDAVLVGFEAATLYLNQNTQAIKARNSIGETVFHWFVVENNIEAVSWLHSMGSELDTQNEFGDTPLAEAASLGQLEICKYLLHLGANPCVVSERGYSSIGEAAIAENVEILEMLISHMPGEVDINSQFDAVFRTVLLDLDGPSASVLRANGLIID